MNIVLASRSRGGNVTGYDDAVHAYKSREKRRLARRTRTTAINTRRNHRPL